MDNYTTDNTTTANNTDNTKPLVVSTPDPAINDYNKITSDVNNLSTGVQQQTNQQTNNPPLPQGGSDQYYKAMKGEDPAFVGMISPSGDPMPVPKGQEQVFLNSGFKLYNNSPQQNTPQNQPSQQTIPSPSTQNVPTQTPPPQENPQKTFNEYLKESEQALGPSTPINTEPDLTKFNESQNRIDETQKQYQDELSKINQRIDEAFNQFKSATDQIRNGTFPLNADQQVQLKGMQDSFDRIRKQQEEVNKSYVAGITQAGIASGRNRYAPEMELGNIANAVNVGIQKIGDLESKAALTLSEIKQGMQDKNYGLVKEQYAVLQDYLNQKNNTISKIYEQTLNYEKEMRDLNYKLAQDTVQNQLQSRQLDMQQKKDVFERAMTSAQFDANQRKQIADEYYRQQEFDYEMKKQNKEEVQSEIERLASSGITADQLGDENLSRLEQLAGYTPGTLRSQFDAVYAAQQIKTEADLATAQEKIVNLLTKIPEGQTVTIGGSTYNGMKEIDPKKGLYSFTETDGRGQVTQIVTRYNPQTGKMEMVDKLNFGSVGKGFKGFSGGGGGSGGGSGAMGGGVSALGNNTTVGKALDKLLTNYPSDFKYYVKEIGPSVKFQLNQKSVADLFGQYQDMKRKSILPFGQAVKGTSAGSINSSNKSSSTTPVKTSSSNQTSSKSVREP